MGPFLKRGSHLYLDWEKEICEKQDECVAAACLSQSQVSVKNTCFKKCFSWFDGKRGW